MDRFLGERSRVDRRSVDQAPLRYNTSFCICYEQILTFERKKVVGEDVFTGIDFLRHGDLQDYRENESCDAES